jgi:hypothetical protein
LIFIQPIAKVGGVGGKGNSNSRTLRWGIAVGLIAIVGAVAALAAGESDSTWDIEANLTRKEAATLTGAESMLVENRSALPEDKSHPAAAPDSDPEAGGGWKPTFNDEALPCTGDQRPVNFETFSAGPSLEGLPLTYTERRCGSSGSAATRANYLSYVYGDCEIVAGATGCQPPLEIQTWPACQRYLAKYSFRGEPLPHRRLEKRDGAEVVEFNFALDKRIEVYTKASTVVIFAVDRSLALKAVEMLRLEEKGKPPATQPGDLKSGGPDGLGPPEEGSLEGDLSCQA